jgi:hypothetical protein
MRRAILAIVGLGLSCAAIVQAADESPHVVIVSVDGLMPRTYTTAAPSKVPVLRGLAADGAWARGVVGVMPSVTYPSHTTMITGVPPAVHGIVSNRILDPENHSNSAWYWFAEAIKSVTLPGAVRSRGLRAGAVNWPVTIGMDLDYLVPEYTPWRHATGLLLLDALTRPAGVIRSAEAAAGRPFPWPFTDRDRVDLAIHIIKTWRPHLLLLHVFETDSAAHTYGPDSPEALEAVERIDSYLGSLFDAARAAVPAERLHLVVVSDHGFAATEHQLHPNVALRREGLIDVDEHGRVTAWRAWFHSNGGSGFVYLKDPSDTALAGRVEGVLRALAADPANGIASVWTAGELEGLGADPGARFGVEMRPPFYSGIGVSELLTRTADRGGHGYTPTRPELHGSLVMSGPLVRGAGDLGIVRMTQLAPTIASWFEVGLSPRADDPITLTSVAGQPR